MTRLPWVTRAELYKDFFQTVQIPTDRPNFLTAKRFREVTENRKHGVSGVGWSLNSIGRVTQWECWCSSFAYPHHSLCGLAACGDTCPQDVYKACASSQNTCVDL